MRWKSRFALLAGTACVAHFVVAAPPKPQPKVEQKVTGPVANYWMSAATSTPRQRPERAPGPPKST